MSFLWTIVIWIQVSLILFNKNIFSLFHISSLPFHILHTNKMYVHEAFSIFYLNQLRKFVQDYLISGNHIKNAVHLKTKKSMASVVNAIQLHFSMHNQQITLPFRRAVNNHEWLIFLHTDCWCQCSQQKTNVCVCSDY